jgi:hypothetical protein
MAAPLHFIGVTRLLQVHPDAGGAAEAAVLKLHWHAVLFIIECRFINH